MPGLLEIAPVAMHGEEDFELSSMHKILWAII